MSFERTVARPGAPSSVPSGQGLEELVIGDRQIARPANALTFAGWLIPTIGQLIFTICLAVVLMVGPKFVSADGDASRHLTVGEYMLSNGILRQDVFSHTKAGEEFVPYEWLAETASALTYRVAGLAGPVLLHGAAIALTFALLYSHLRRRGHPLLLALAVTLLAAASSALHWLARPHVFTFLGTAVFASALDLWYRRQTRRRALWLLPAVMVLWVNAHGGFLIGLILVAAYAGADIMRWLARDGFEAEAARDRLRALALPAIATIGATLVNPAGPGLYAHVTGYFGKRLLVNRTHEYLSPDFHEADALPFLAMLLGLILCFGWSRIRPSLHEGLLCVGFTYFALHSARNIPLFAIIAAPIVAAQLEAFALPSLATRWHRVVGTVADFVSRRNEVYGRMEDRARGHLWPITAVGGLVLAAAFQVHSGVEPLNVRFDSARQPVAAAEYLKANPPEGNGYNELVWGGYLLHQLWPEKQVFIDGQTDFYGEELTRDYLRVAELSNGWQSVLDHHDVRWVIYPTNTPLVRALAAMPDWQVTFQDETATVLRRPSDRLHLSAR